MTAITFGRVAGLRHYDLSGIKSGSRPAGNAGNVLKSPRIVLQDLYDLTSFSFTTILAEHFVG